MRLRNRATVVASVIAGTALVATSATAATSDPLRGDQWGLDQINAEQAWTSSTGSGSVVAVVDSGVDLDHPDLAGQLVPGITTVGCQGQTYCGDGDWVGMDGEAQDVDAHGTHVSGIVAAATDNVQGVAGVAPDAQVMPIKSLENGSGSFGDIAAGIDYAVDNGADVVNLSLGALPGSQVLTLTGLETSVVDAIANATANGVLVVAAAGNETVPICDTPAFEAGALCVTATDRNERPSLYSNGGIKLDFESIAAPGGFGFGGCQDDIVSTVPVGTGSDACGQEDYDYFAGTSMAAPHVAGVAALLYAQGRSRDNVRDAMLDTASAPLLPLIYGTGIVDAAAAVGYPAG